jgi:L,D-peptidoglycan transpeptidase YkuD (ErfK/YbiS/YcfS/YnhG family)
VVVTAKTMSEMSAEMRLYERASVSEPWRAASEPEPAMLGRAGMGWSHFFRRYAKAGEPLKAEGDRRAPAGIYPIGPSFGILPSPRPGYLHVTEDTVCVNEPSSRHYNAITSRKLIQPNTSVENMSRALPMYRRGLVVGYPTDGKARAGSCIFIHVWRSPTSRSCRRRRSAGSAIACRRQVRRQPGKLQLIVRLASDESSEKAGICTSKPSPEAETTMP